METGLNAGTDANFSLAGSINLKGLQGLIEFKKKPLQHCCKVDLRPNPTLPFNPPRFRNYKVTVLPVITHSYC